MRPMIQVHCPDIKLQMIAAKALLQCLHMRISLFLCVSMKELMGRDGLAVMDGDTKGVQRKKAIDNLLSVCYGEYI